MNHSVEIQIISKILTSSDQDEINTLCAYDDSYYSVYKEPIKFILDHRAKYNQVPDLLTFQTEFSDDIVLVDVNEPTEYLEQSIIENKQYIQFLEMFNKLQEVGTNDLPIGDIWTFIGQKYDEAVALGHSDPLDIIHDAEKRAQQVIELSKQARIPTGFKEIDQILYGGFSTVEELAIIIARTNNGKSWIVTKMVETAQANGFPCAFYSPEMAGWAIGTRFDTFRGHFTNSDLQQGKYSDEYKAYIKQLPNEEAPVYLIEDKDFADGVSVRKLETFVRKHKIKELIVDGLSYMIDDQKSNRDYEKFQNITLDLFKLSKKLGCAVVITLQANRDAKEEKDEKGVPFPSLYTIAGSDAPARIATQVFAIRQIFESHILDIRLEKSRNASNQKPVISYSWDIGTGNMTYTPSEDSTQLVMPYQDTGQGGLHSLVPSMADSSGDVILPPGLNTPPGPDMPKDELGSDDIVEF